MGKIKSKGETSLKGMKTIKPTKGATAADAPGTAATRVAQHHMFLLQEPVPEYEDDGQLLLKCLGKAEGMLLLCYEIPSQIV